MLCYVMYFEINWNVTLGKAASSPVNIAGICLLVVRTFLLALYVRGQTNVVGLLILHCKTEIIIWTYLLYSEGLLVGFRRCRRIVGDSFGIFSLFLHMITDPWGMSRHVPRSFTFTANLSCVAQAISSRSLSVECRVRTQAMPCWMFAVKTGP